MVGDAVQNGRLADHHGYYPPPASPNFKGRKGIRNLCRQRLRINAVLDMTPVQPVSFTLQCSSRCSAAARRGRLACQSKSPSVCFHQQHWGGTHRSPSRRYHPVFGFLVCECNQTARLVSIRSLLCRRCGLLTPSPPPTPVSGVARGLRVGAGSIPSVGVASVLPCSASCSCHRRRRGSRRVRPPSSWAAGVCGEGGAKNGKGEVVGPGGRWLG